MERQRILDLVQVRDQLDPQIRLEQPAQLTVLDLDLHPELRIVVHLLDPIPQARHLLLELILGQVPERQRILDRVQVPDQLDQVVRREQQDQLTVLDLDQRGHQTDQVVLHLEQMQGLAHQLVQHHHNLISNRHSNYPPGASV